MRTGRGLDRLVFFTDAVAAIAITLLILPLVDLVASEPTRNASLPDFLREHLPQLGSFALSFAVIARLWIAHHGLFEHVKSYSRWMMTVNLFWAFTIVLLPLPTAIVAGFQTSPLSVGLYIGTMTLSSAALTVMAAMIRRDPDLEVEQNRLTARSFLSSLVSTISFVIALVIGVVFPAVNFFALLLLFLDVPVEAMISRRFRMSAE